MKIAQSPLSALRASSGDWLIVTLGLQEISSLLILRPEDLYRTHANDSHVFPNFPKSLAFSNFFPRYFLNFSEFFQVQLFRTTVKIA